MIEKKLSEFRENELMKQKTDMIAENTRRNDELLERLGNSQISYSRKRYWFIVSPFLFIAPLLALYLWIDSLQKSLYNSANRFTALFIIMVFIWVVGFLIISGHFIYKCKHILLGRKAIPISFFVFNINVATILFFTYIYFYTD